jgi:hypothetical protein
MQLTQGFKTELHITAEKHRSRGQTQHFLHITRNTLKSIIRITFKIVY